MQRKKNNRQWEKTETLIRRIHSDQNLGVRQTKNLQHVHRQKERKKKKDRDKESDKMHCIKRNLTPKVFSEEFIWLLHRIETLRMRIVGIRTGELTRLGRSHLKCFISDVIFITWIEIHWTLFWKDKIKWNVYWIDQLLTSSQWRCCTID